MSALCSIGKTLVGAGQPVYVIAEIGINHDGSPEHALALVEGAWRAGADAVKFQKRTPEACVPRDQWELPRDTPWGRMTYLEYKRRIELDEAAFTAIDALCARLGIEWFASAWDEEALGFVERFSPPCHKVASASLTDHALLRAMRATGRPLMLSTGMSTLAQVEATVRAIGTHDLCIAHSTSAYPCAEDELNLRVLSDLAQRWPQCPIGYSGHEAGIAPSLAAVALGATFIERHLTTDRARWGSDHAASLDLAAFAEMVREVRVVSRALGDGRKRVYASELPHRTKLRRVSADETDTLESAPMGADDSDALEPAPSEPATSALASTARSPYLLGDSEHPCP
ncbi:MAG: N-acetylneuraminate synthase family protein [Polyangiaceae bacterium]